MRILDVFCVYNEMEVLPYVLKYYQEEGIEVFVLDNYSTDGTWEYLQGNRIPSARVDTEGAFDLRILQKAKMDVVKKFNPNWVIYGDGDEFILSMRSLKDVIGEADERGFNKIEMTDIDFYNTGEERKEEDPRGVYFYCKVKKPALCRIHKKNGFREYHADDAFLDSQKTTKAEDSCVWDFGMTKPKDKRYDVFRRRELACERGLPRGYNNVYAVAAERNWIWDKEELEDIRTIPYWGIYRK